MHYFQGGEYEGISRQSKKYGKVTFAIWTKAAFYNSTSMSNRQDQFKPLSK
jgi:hypothetical protein